jgi:hypothetical protein
MTLLVINTSKIKMKVEILRGMIKIVGGLPKKRFVMDGG